MIDLVDAILAARPGEKWTLDGENLSGLKWLSETAPPTKKEIESAWVKLQEKRELEKAAEQAARAAAIEHAKSLGFTDAMIAVMYPNLAVSGDVTE